jgi:hypothetical protein
LLKNISKVNLRRVVDLNLAVVAVPGHPAGDPALLKKGETDIAVCNANLDNGAVDDGARKCMGLKGYALVRKDEAEDARAGFAAAQRVSTPSAGGGSK